MKLLRSMTLASGIAALLAFVPLHAADQSQQRSQSAPQQLGGPGAPSSGGQANQSDADRASSAEAAGQYGGQSGSVGGSMSGSTGGQGRAQSDVQSGSTDSRGHGASGGGQYQGSSELGSPANESLNRSSTSTPSSTTR